MRFSSLVCVRDWLAPLANSTQQRIDDSVRLLKLGALPMPQRPSAEPMPDGMPRSSQFGKDLHSVMRLIEDLSEDLTSDAEILVRHGEKLQNLDIALQMIAVVADALASPIGEDVVAARLGNLRISCAAALEKDRRAP